MFIIYLKSAVHLLLISLLFAITACSSSSNNRSTKEVLDVPVINPCMHGSISPPGVNDCLKIDDILANNIKVRAPKGRCPANWQKHTPSGFCIPAYHLLSCGTFTFACHIEKADTFRIIKGEPKCKDGSIVVTAPAPVVDHESGLYLGTTTVLVCGPPSSHKPV